MDCLITYPNQVEFNIIHTHLLDAGIIANQNNPRLVRNHDLIEYCRLNEITLQAWSPLAHGYLSGNSAPDDSPNIQEAATVVAEMAEENGVSCEAIVIAWILRHPAGIQPLPGTTNPERFLAGRGEALP